MGPLAGVKVLEMAGIGPAPMAAMQLADMGATVLRIERREPVDLGVPRPLNFNLLLRNREAVALDLKDPQSIALVLELVAQADILIEGFRPGVMERLGIGPERCHAINPQLVYGRMTGWGQDGPLAHAAGHDINYIALTGALNAIGRKGQPPVPPLALVGDFGGGAMFLVMGVLAALHHAQRSGQGQVVDAAIVEGASSLATAFHGFVAGGQWDPERGSNLLDGGAPHYDSYECSDGRFVSVGPIEARFHAELVRRLGLDEKACGAPGDRSRWEHVRAELTRVFKTRTQAEWCALLEGTDVCFAPVLSFDEASSHPHLKARGSFVEVDGVVQPAPTPRFSATPSAKPTPPRAPDGAKALRGWLADADIARWSPHCEKPSSFDSLTGQKT
ncbi:CaiB/BaiF CoA transferase family protein [Diaphorobacter caeni]|uniref:CaiB/BaiF CoA transferase family protein n=1 Tax=Diaphorobacter caeni TaxID=2784387 RepID=UPI00188FED64|nr:CaiB/BaiF CoA-transferase family protein [Diaphorobacter caeni]MBF5006738.1 CoA transferase [Diaphorobacter caeni]